VGAERIGQKVNALSYYADVERPSRGHWHCTFRAMTAPAEGEETFSTTDKYMEMLEEMIQKQPAYWLWSHNRWKRTYEEWIRRQNEKA
jgi:KDO2-lipid IV(A) lauroyltransferase